MSVSRVFLFGTALLPEMAKAYGLGEGKDALLTGFSVRGHGDWHGASLRAAAEGQINGRMTEANDSFGYLMRALGATGQIVETSEGAALAYSWPSATAPWDLGVWLDPWAPIILRAVQEIKTYQGQRDAADVHRSMSQLLVRASSAARAAGNAAPMRLRSGLTASDVAETGLRRPYLDFFMLEERDVSFAHFTGGQSQTVQRAALVSGDAVTVLPYDPVRDRVLLIEQFRFGPYARGDDHPWSLEPIAGRIDPGEEPEETAKREALEEAGLALDRLEFVARYYPSPGAVSEYLYSYIAVADLPDEVAGIGGLDSEAEDIKSLVLSFDELQALIASGEAENGPLLISAMWLAANRERLRAGS